MTVIQIENLKCEGCANTIKKGLLSINTIEDIEINIETSEVKINSDDDVVLEEVVKKLSSMGYPQVGDPNSILKKAQSFVSCAVGRMSKEE